MINIILFSTLTSLGGIIEYNDELQTELSPTIAGVPSSAVKDGWLTVRTTAYTHSESDHKKWGRKTASGRNLRFGKTRSAAADWSKFPLGTRFETITDTAAFPFPACP